MDYRLTLVTPPEIEPISLQEAKKYCRIDTTDDSGGLIITQSIPPGIHPVTDLLNGLSVDVLGTDSTVIFEAGDFLGEVSVKVQHSNDGTNWEDFYEFVPVDSSNDNQNYSVQYTGDNQYIRAVAIVESGECEFAVNIVLDQSDTYEDQYISALITVAREYCEGFQGRAYITQEWEMSFEHFCNVIEIPKGKLQSIEEFKYIDSSGVEHEMIEGTDYVYSTRGMVGRTTTPYGVSWPSFTAFPLDPVVIRFKCGYGDNASDVPQKVKQAMRLLISHWYENRTPLSSTNTIPREIKFAVEALLLQDRILNH